METSRLPVYNAARELYLQIVEATRRFFREADRALEEGTATPADLLPNLNSRLGYLSHFSEWRAVDRMVRSSPALLQAFRFNQKLTKAKII